MVTLITFYEGTKRDRIVFLSCFMVFVLPHQMDFPEIQYHEKCKKENNRTTYGPMETIGKPYENPL